MRNGRTVRSAQQSIKIIAIVAIIVGQREMYQTSESCVTQFLYVSSTTVCTVVTMYHLFPCHLAIGGNLGNQHIAYIGDRTIGRDWQQMRTAVPGRRVAELPEDIQISFAVGHRTFDNVALLARGIALGPLEILRPQTADTEHQNHQNKYRLFHIDIVFNIFCKSTQNIRHTQTFFHFETAN